MGMNCAALVIQILQHIFSCLRECSELEMDLCHAMKRKDFEPSVVMLCAFFLHRSLTQNHSCMCDVIEYISIYVYNLTKLFLPVP